MRDHPIPQVTEPLQYRAIGIVRGIYRPEEKEKFTRGTLIDQNGNKIDSVVLGRVVTLMRRYLEEDKPHLWVVYPRCREAGHLHLQIAGIWEPSTLDKTSFSKDVDSSKKLESDNNLLDELPEGDDYFSIRGELIYTRPENNQFVVKVRQKPRQNKNKPLPFKLIIDGKIPIEEVRNFVSLNVRRKINNLVLEDYELLGTIPHKGVKKKVIGLSHSIKKNRT